MRSDWNDLEAARFPGPLGPRVYTSRLLGRDPTFVLHGGGNTSVKLAGEDGEVLWVKGSGADLGRIGESGFAGLRLDCVRAILDEPRLDNPEMARRLRACLLREPAPRPSIETLMHGALPHRYVEHTHADAVLALANTENGPAILERVYGELAPLVPYRHSGVELARACVEAFRSRATPRTIGLVLRFHGVVAFGENAHESFENMLRLAAMAEDDLRSRDAWTLPEDPRPAAPDPLFLARLRSEVSRAAGFPLVARIDDDPVVLAFARRADLAEIAMQGPATPQHAVFARRLPLLGSDAERHASACREYLDRTLGAAWHGALDPAPRIALNPAIGMVAFGVDARHAAIAAEIYRHDIEVIARASAHDRYRSAPEADIARAELEYGGFEARIRNDPARPRVGRVALVTLAAAQRDPALAARLAAEGAALAVPAGTLPDGKSVMGYDRALDAPAVAAGVVLAFGGIDELFAEAEDSAWKAAAAPFIELSAVPGAPCA